MELEKAFNGPFDSDYSMLYPNVISPIHLHRGKPEIIPEAESQVKEILGLFPEIEIKEGEYKKHYFNFGPIHLKKKPNQYFIMLLEKESKSILKIAYEDEFMTNAISSMNIGGSIHPSMHLEPWLKEEYCRFRLAGSNDDPVAYTTFDNCHTREELFSMILNVLKKGCEFRMDAELYVQKLICKIPPFNSIEELRLRLAIAGK